MAGQASASTPSTSSSTTICRPSAASVLARRSPAQTFRQPLPRQVKSHCHGQRLHGRFTKTFTGETVPFSFTLENAEGAYTFDFPEVQISGDWPDAGSTDIVQVQLDITAANTPPTITRVPKVPATAISVAPATSTGAVGSTVTLTATLTPVDSTDAVQWTSSDPTIASVVSTGRKQRKSRVTQPVRQPSPVRPAPLRQRLKSSLPRLNLPDPFRGASRFGLFGSLYADYFFSN